MAPPEKAFRCAYVARQIPVKTCVLSVTPSEKTAIGRALAAGPGSVR